MNPQFIRRIILEQSKRANVGHIGSCLSVTEIVAALYGDVLQISDASDPDRDRFVLSKGHAALAVYAALFLKGIISQELLETFHTDLSWVGVHPEHILPGIDFTTGSLGQGLSMGAGAALAARMQGSTRRVFVLLSDAECNEGSVWEAIMFAAHQRLATLVAIVDMNGQQALGFTEDVLSLSPMGDRWRAFGWDVHEVDGHNLEEMVQTIRDFDFQTGKPHVLLAKTMFGKGVSYMEGALKWHYWPMSNEEFEMAIAEIGAQ